MRTATRAAVATMIHRVLDFMTQAPSVANTVGRSELKQRELLSTFHRETLRAPSVHA